MPSPTSAAGVPTYTSWSDYESQNQDAVAKQDAAVEGGLAQDAANTAPDAATGPGSAGTPGTPGYFQSAPEANGQAPSVFGYSEFGQHYNYSPNGEVTGSGVNPETGQLIAAGPYGNDSNYESSLGHAVPATTGTPATQAAAPQAFQQEWGLLASPEGFQQLAAKYGAAAGSATGENFDAMVNPGGASKITGPGGYDPNNPAQAWDYYSSHGGSAYIPDSAMDAANEQAGTNAQGQSSPWYSPGTGQGAGGAGGLGNPLKDKDNGNG
jgi:hypothetical protein